MSLSSVFQVLQLAIGPSLPYTMGALKVGQFFREVLIGVPYHQDNRVLVEFLGDFEKFGKDNSSHMALIAGLSGYVSGETRMSIRKMYSIIHKEGGFQLLSKTWPFNDESDLIFNKKSTEFSHPNTIRFHVVSVEGKVLLQAEYTVSGKGLVSGPGSRDTDPGSNIDQIDSLEEILKICKAENLSLLEYIYSSEELIHGISVDQILQRMLNTWKIIESSIDNGLGNSTNIHAEIKRKAHIIYSHYQEILPIQDLISKEHAQASMFACGVCEESLANQLVITAPVCETSGVLSAVLKSLQSKYLFSKSQMAEALLIAGFIGSVLQKLGIRFFEKNKIRLDFPIATAMAAASGMFLVNKDPEAILKVIHIALDLAENDPDYSTENLIKQNIKHANLALASINLALIGYPIDQTSMDKAFQRKIKTKR